MENVKKVIEPPRREDAKGFIYFLIGVTDREKNHALTGKSLLQVVYHSFYAVVLPKNASSHKKSKKNIKGKGSKNQRKT